MADDPPTRKPSTTPVLRRPAAPDADRPRLGTLGQIYVTLTAAERYAEEQRLRPEEARRELTELLLDARVQEEGQTMRVRARSRTTQIDVSATVVREGRLLVVTSIHSREHLRG